MAVKKVPEGHNGVSPYLIVAGAVRAIDFYTKAFGAVELFRHTAPTGKVGHAEVRIGDTVVMLADAHPDFDAHGPAHYGGSPISLHMYVEDVDAVARQAIAAGAKGQPPAPGQFYGDRPGTCRGPVLLPWPISTHIEDVSGEELVPRAL